MTEDILDEQELVSQVNAENHFTTQMNRVGRIVAVGSFAIGTFLFLLNLLLFRHESMLMIVGMYYVMLAAGINGIIFLLVFFSLFRAKNKRKVWATMGIMLLNVPVSFGYFLLVVGHLS